MLRNNNLSLPYTSHKGRTKHRNLFRHTGPDQLWETDITYIPRQRDMTYLMCIKDSFTKEWQGYNYSRTCLATDAVISVEDAVLRSFGGEVPGRGDTEDGQRSTVQFTAVQELCKRRLIFPQKRRNKIPQLYLFFYSSFFTSLNVGNEFFFLSLSL